MKHSPVDRSDRAGRGCRRWAVGNVHTGAEIAVAKRLEGDGLDVYCPRFEKPARPRHGRKRQQESVVKAVFPGYLFVNRDSIVNLEAIYETPDFHYFIRNDEKLSLLHDDAIDGLRALEQRGILLPTSIEALIEQFAMGDVVRVLDGPFGGMLGTVVSEDKGRVILSGYDFQIPSEMPADNLKLEDS